MACKPEVLSDIFHVLSSLLEPPVPLKSIRKVRQEKIKLGTASRENKVKKGKERDKKLNIFYKAGRRSRPLKKRARFSNGLKL